MECECCRNTYLAVKGLRIVLTALSYKEKWIEDWRQNSAGGLFLTQVIQQETAVYQTIDITGFDTYFLWSRMHNSGLRCGLITGKVFHL
jgi:hypothetical protein